MQLPSIVMQVQSGSSVPDALCIPPWCGKFLPLMAWDVMVVDKEEGVSARNPFCVGRRSHAYALA